MKLKINEIELNPALAVFVIRENNQFSTPHLRLHVRTFLSYDTLNLAK